MSIEHAEKNQESIEQPRFKGIKVFRVRHGETKYLEHNGLLTEGAIDLTEKGIGQIKESAATIANRIDRENSIVFVISSPRKRAVDSADFLESELRSLGFEIGELKERHKDIAKKRLEGTNVLGKDGNTVPTSDPQHAILYKEAVEEIKKLSAGVEPPPGFIALWEKDLVPNMEPRDDVMERVRGELTMLKRISNRFAGKTEKAIVVVQLEHTETIDEMLEVASSGVMGGVQGNEVEKGEVFELDIPADKDEIHVTALGRELEPKTIKFDYLERKFG
jgi:hypothetical protein